MIEDRKKDKGGKEESRERKQQLRRALGLRVSLQFPFWEILINLQVNSTVHYK
jgi:hypothetical protein